MPEAPPPEALRPPAPRRGRRRRIALALLGFFALLLGGFHQPLLREGLKRVAIRLAARENVQLALEVEGSGWTHLTLKNLRAVSTGPSPVESIRIERLRVEDHLWTLLREGPGDFLTFYNLRNARIALDPGKGSEDQKRHLLHALRDILEQPAMCSDRAQIENLNLTLRTPEGVYVFNDVHALLDPVQRGYIRVGELTVPHFGAWHGLRAGATYMNRHLVLRDFNLGEEVRVARLELDASHRDKGIHSLSFEGTVWGGDLGLFLWQRESASGAIQAQLTDSLRDLPLEALGKYAGWKTPVTGTLKQAWVHLNGDPLTPSAWQGQATAQVGQGAIGGFPLGEVSASLSVGEGVARIDHLQVSTGKSPPALSALPLNGGDKLEGSARVILHEPFAYEARLAGSVRDIALFQPLLETPLGGTLEIDWHGTGEIQRMRHSGEGRVALQGGRVAQWSGVEGELAGVYSPESIEITALRLRCDQGTLQAGVRLRDQCLHVEGLRLTAGKTGVATGSFSLPLDLRTPTRRETVFPASGALAGTVVLEQIDLAQLFPAARPGLAVRGSASGSLSAGGTLAAPDLTVRLAVRDLVSGAAEKFTPASGEATLRFHQGRAALSGTLAQPGLSTLSFQGEMPLNLRQALAERRIDPATPIVFSVKLPPSDAGLFVPLIPGVRMLDGRLSMDASATGTLEKPTFSGGVALHLEAIRFQATDMPGINHLRGDLRFAGAELTFQRCTGDMAGGPFSVTGRLRFDPLADPVFDLRLQSQGTLIVRNDTLTLRTDSDLRLTGPFSKALLSGKVGVTKSRFFREIEILPIGLPGRPVPKPANGWFDLSISTPPLRDWSYDVAIRTVEPFAVKGNLANGSLEADLHLGGTGLAPGLEGMARIENFVASLPFSRLTVDYGTLYFDGGAALNPTLDIHGSSRIRDYNVNVYLYGTASEPQTLFTSEPSLPQEEVIALLATGATTRDFAQNNQALAGRAAVLLFQDLSRKLFPRRPPSDNNSNPMDRFSLDVGGVDPRTGRQELMGKFKLSDQYQIGAGVDMQGDMRMQLQYLIRFR